MALFQSMEDKLVFAQAVLNHGTSNWESVFSEINQFGHPMNLELHGCPGLWQLILDQVNHTRKGKITEFAQLPGSQDTVDIIKYLFYLRMAELRHAIKDKEAHFLSISREIQEIQAGKWDERITSWGPQTKPKPPVAPPISPEVEPTTPVVKETPQPPAKPVENEEKNDDQDDVEMVEQEPEPADDVEMKENVKSPSPEPPAKSPTPAPRASRTRKGAREKVEPVRAPTPVEEADDQEEIKQEEDNGDEEEEPEPQTITRTTRSRKHNLEPLEIPTDETKNSRDRRGRVKKEQAPASPRVSRRGRTGTDIKSVASPATMSVADTHETHLTPPAAAPDEDVSMVDEVPIPKKKTRGHKRKASEMEPETPVSAKRLRDRSTTVDADPPTTPATTKLKTAMSQAVSQLMKSEHADIFLRPVTKKEATDYMQAVLRPTDLTTIQKQIKVGSISSWEELELELRRMLANSCVYNRPGTEAFEAAKLMLIDVEDALETARESPT